MRKQNWYNKKAVDCNIPEIKQKIKLAQVSQFIILFLYMAAGITCAYLLYNNYIIFPLYFLIGLVLLIIVIVDMGDHIFSLRMLIMHKKLDAKIDVMLNKGG